MHLPWRNGTSASDASHAGLNMYEHDALVDAAANVAGNAAHGEAIETVTVWPSAWTSAMFASAGPVSELNRQVLMLNAIAAPSNGSPSWNVMPSRAVIVHWVKSSFGSRLSSRFGTNVPSSAGAIRLSDTICITIMQLIAQLTRYGAHGLAESASTP